MGFMDKIKHVLEGSGVAVQVQTMGSSDPSGQVQLVRVTLEAKSEPKAVTNIEISILDEETSEQRSFGDDVDHTTTQTRTLFEFNQPVQLQLQPGQPVTQDFQIPVAGVLNGAAPSSWGGLGTVLNTVLGTSETVILRARATVDGSSLHPHADQVLQRSGGGWMI